MAETQDQARERLARDAFSVNDKIDFANAEQSAAECMELFDRAKPGRIPSAYEVIVFTEARLLGRWFLRGMPAPNPDWRPAAEQWARARA